MGINREEERSKLSYVIAKYEVDITYHRRQYEDGIISVDKYLLKCHIEKEDLIDSIEEIME